MYNTQEHNKLIYTFRQYNIQFSRNTEKEQIIKKTCNNKQIEFLCEQTPFQIT